MVKNEWGLIDHGSLSRLIEWFLHADSDGIISYSVSVTSKCWGTTAVVLSQSPDLGFTTRFWTSLTELFVTMNSVTIAERNKNQWIYQRICDIQVIWKLSYVILRLRRSLFLNSLNNELCWLFSLFCINYFHRAHNQAK